MAKDFVVSILESRDDCASISVGQPFKFSYEFLARYGCLHLLGKTYKLVLESSEDVYPDGECMCAFAGMSFVCPMFPCTPSYRVDKKNVRVVAVSELDGE